jgi:uncharacterized protein (DUF924 family)
MNTPDRPPWSELIDFWFPEGRVAEVDLSTHRDHWLWRMRGGADSEIRSRFSDLTESAAEGHLGEWASEPHGRLPLIVVLDQFSRSVWRGASRAYAQDTVALSLAMDGIANGHYSALGTPWFKVVFALPLGHCEGPDHLERLDLLVQLRGDLLAEAPVQLLPVYESLLKQAQDVREVIAAFGRHPHRNAILGRSSTPAEAAYIAEGRFPHARLFEPR